MAAEMAWCPPCAIAGTLEEPSSGEVLVGGDLRTLTAVGASGGIRRTIVGATAGVIGTHSAHPPDGNRPLTDR